MRSPGSRLASLPRGLQFALLGGLLFAGRGFLPGAAAERPPVKIAAPQVETWAADFALALGRPPNAAELHSLVEQKVGEKLLENEARRLRLDFGDRSIEQRLIAKMRAIATDLHATDDQLYRQALALGLDDDLVVNRQLREKMRLFLQRDPAPAPFTGAELEDALLRHAATFRQPPLFGFSHLFVGVGQHGEKARERAEALRQQILAHALPVETALESGDPFPLAAQVDGRSQQQIAKTFGPDFAAAVAEQKPGFWSPPIASPFGWHLVHLHQKTEGGLPTAQDLREPLVALLAEERAAIRLQQGIDRLRSEYQVEIEWPAAIEAELRALERSRK